MNRSREKLVAAASKKKDYLLLNYRRKKVIFYNLPSKYKTYFSRLKK